VQQAITFFDRKTCGNCSVLFHDFAIVLTHILWMQLYLAAKRCSNSVLHVCIPAFSTTFPNFFWKAILVPYILWSPKYCYSNYLLLPFSFVNTRFVFSESHQAAAVLLNAALVATQWQYRALNVCLHPPINNHELLQRTAVTKWKIKSIFKEFPFSSPDLAKFGKS